MACNLYRRFFVTGPGGINCPCCYPAAGKGRKILERTFKRREKMNAMKTAMKEIVDNSQLNVPLTNG